MANPPSRGILFWVIMSILTVWLLWGGGKVIIGNNFHSGPECLMICQSHNFDGGTKIPYDDTYIYKDITIEDQV